MRIDHVIYVTDDLDAAAARIESDLGLESVQGGRHEGHGTHNRIVPLGRGYLELLAIADPDEAADSPIGAAVRSRLDREGQGLLAWAVSVDDVAVIAERIESPVMAIGRQGLTARLAGVGDALQGTAQPFFIERDRGVPDPGAEHDAGGITWVELSCDLHELERRLGGAELPLRLVDGPTGLRAIGIGDRELRTA